MLIRSQDKKKIINYDNYDGMAITELSETDFSLCAVKEIDAEHVSHVSMGNYRTEQKCLDIMDEICSYHQIGRTFLATGKSKVEPAFVYDMPEKEKGINWILTERVGYYKCPLCGVELKFYTLDNSRTYDAPPDKCPCCGGIVRRG